jgi:glycosyltransferase involved in cell wall biosynthesis
MSIRVLEVIPTLKRAGAENVVAALAGRLDRGQFELGVVSLYDRFAEGLELDVPVWYLGKRRGLDVRMVPRLAAVMREFRPEVVHTHSYVLRYTLPAGWMTGPRAMVHTVHNMAEREADRLGRAIQGWAFRRGVMAVAIGAEVARSFRAVYGREPARTISNGVDTAAFYRPEARAAWRGAEGFGADEVLIASVGRFEPQKNPLALIEAFARVPVGRLVMAGEGSLVEAARLKARKLGVEGRVRFLGVRTDVAEMLSACDIFALASDWEGSPLAAMEAMAAGLPAVATAVGGVPELVEDGVTGILAPRGDLQALGNALEALAGNQRLRREMGDAARERSKRFEVSAMVEAYAALFQEMVRR